MIIILGFISLYIYPNQPRNATNYPIYFYFNAILFTIFIFNIPNALAFVLHWFFEKKSIIISLAGFVISAGLGISLLYGVVIGKQNLTVKEVTLTYRNLPKNFDNYRIVQFSDLHIGGMLKSNTILNKTKTKFERMDPDLLLFTGDLVNNFQTETNGFLPVLKDMGDLSLSYSTLGNHDYGDYTDWDSPEEKLSNLEGIISVLNETGFTLLENQHTVIKKGNDSIFLVGVENWGHPPFPQYANLEKALQGVPEEAFTILMTHDPAHWESQVKGKKSIELTLSGHTHGLQWGLKPAGISFSLACLTSKYWGGLYRNGASVLYVNTGLGTIGIPWRLDMQPEITVFTLKRGEID
ncbi:metallophosphoesterase [Tangfeifania diversioriginum]|uniref:metallophosphoesterase n=1 Tax=Tangfeifania diversioriginum TaxID=1168035 RepID=UPI00158716F0|nr:metallophosphoesterase [Tangfeifania diversioriginum]